ncbi:GH23540 [Drosophila grimshawi]|uniref:GH23540 n=1 Tax=Drosophila grimshawi TaxID=7222 RepID=B4K3Y8_DROGR|nr:GH23540 [Drosophila grimshawi]
MQLFIQIALMCLINTLLPDIIRNYVSEENNNMSHLITILNSRVAAQNFSFLEENSGKHTNPTINARRST